MKLLLRQSWISILRGLSILDSAGVMVAYMGAPQVVG